MELAPPSVSARLAPPEIRIAGEVASAKGAENLYMKTSVGFCVRAAATRSLSL